MTEGKYGVLPFFLWLFSLIGFTLQFPFRISKDLFDLFEKNKRFFLLLILVYSIRLPWLWHDNLLFFHGDEAIISKNALKMIDDALNSGRWQILGAGEGTISRFPAFWFYLQGLVISFLGPSLFSLKILSMIADFGIAVVLFFLFLRWFNPLFASATVLIYSTLPVAIHFSVTGYQNIFPTFFLFFSLLILSLFDSPSIKKRAVFWLSAVVAGLGFYFYLSALVIPIIIIPILFFYFFKDKKVTLDNVLIWLLGFSVATAPFFIFSFTTYNFVSGRSSAYDFWFKNKDVLAVVLNQTKRFVLGFNQLPANGSGAFYISAPLFPSLLPFFFFLLGLLICLVFLFKKRGFLEMVLVFLVTSIIGGVGTDNPPASQRLIHLYPAFAFFISVGIYYSTKAVSSFCSNIIKKEIVKKRTYFLFWLITSFVVVKNFTFFLTQNLPYYSSLPKTEYRFVKFYQGMGYSLAVLTSIPIHKNPQIYFYSHGKIDPLPVNSYNYQMVFSQFCQNQENFLFLTEERWAWLVDRYPCGVSQRVSWQNPENLLLFYVKTKKGIR